MSLNLNSYAAETRTSMGSTAAQKLRAAGRIPVTISRAGHPSQHLSIAEGQAEHLVKHVVHLCRLEVAGKPATALRGEIVRHCLTDKLIHIDLLAVDEHAEIHVDVALALDARNCAGIKAGGILEQRLRKIRVACKADAIPDSLAFDISDVQIMQTVTADAIKLPAGVRLVTPAKAQVLTIVIPRAMKKAEDAAAPADGAAAAPAEGAAAPADGKKPDDAAKAAAKPEAKK